MPLKKPAVIKPKNDRVRVKSNMRVTQFNLECAFAEKCIFEEACAKLASQKAALARVEADIEAAKATLLAAETTRDQILQKKKLADLDELTKQTEKLTFDEG